MTTQMFVGKPNDAEFPATNFPQLLPINRQSVLAYDAATDEAAMWTGKVPQGFTGTPVCIVTFIMASATSGAVGVQAALECVTPGDALDTDTSDSFDTVNNSASTTVPGTAGYEAEISITLTNNDSMTAGDKFRLKVNRDADGSAITDSASGDMYIKAVELRY